MLRQLISRPYDPLKWTLPENRTVMNELLKIIGRKGLIARARPQQETPRNAQKNFKFEFSAPISELSMILEG